MKTIKVKASKDFIALIKRIKEERKIRHEKKWQYIQDNKDELLNIIKKQ
jgi:hypothetical protein